MRDYPSNKEVLAGYNEALVFVDEFGHFYPKFRSIVPGSTQTY